MVEVAEIERRADHVKTRSIEIGTTLGGVVIQTVEDLEKIAMRLARGMVAVPAHCRDQPGVVYALCMQALEWGMPIMSVINKSYVPRGGDRIGYESQLLHAVVERNAPIKGRLRFEIIGEGDDRRCKVWATFKGEDKPHEYVSETLAKMHPGHVTKDGKQFVKGSPLWDSRPEVQMFYDASRQWARLFCPDVLLGAYAPEELEAASHMVDVTPAQSDKADALVKRLKDAKASHTNPRGFDAEHIVREATASSVIEGDINPDEAKQEGESNEYVNEPDVEGRQDGVGDRDGGDRDQGRSEGDVGDDRQVGGGSAGEQAPRAEEGQGEVFPPDRDAGKEKPKSKR